ncbi:MAG: AAA family ATPase, partial [Cyanobacteria bacterium P01_H01_bin.15]
MIQPSPSLLIGSTSAHSGKSATVLGLCRQLASQGFQVTYSKPLDTGSTLSQESDVDFIARMLSLPAERLKRPILKLSPSLVEKRLTGDDQQNYQQQFVERHEQFNGDLLILEGLGTPWDGSLFDLSLPEMADLLDSPVLMVSRFCDIKQPDSLLRSQQVLGQRLVGVIVNDIPEADRVYTETVVKPYLESKGISVFGLLPADPLLRSISVREIQRQLRAQILCRPDRLDLMVERLTIGAMNVNSALK